MSDTYSINSIFNLSGKTAVITGGSKGLGHEMASCLIQNGCDVMIVSRNVSVAQDLVELSEKYDTHCYLHSCDITSTPSVREMVNDAVEKMGRIDILINSAGMNNPKMIEEMDDDTWKKILDLNLTATFNVTREVVRIMRKNKYGKIINISSMKSIFGTSTDGYTAYCATKGAINMLTKQIACEVAADGITVNAIAPTFIKTAINAKQLDNPVFYKSLVDRIPIGRIGVFKDIMGLLILLATDASQFITGQTLLLDGGIAARQ